MRLPRTVPWAAGLALTLATAVHAADPPLPPTAALGHIRDLTATVRARRVLHDDPALAALNLGVDVERGVATVWGPVPSPAVGGLAKGKLERLKGIEKVNATFHVEEGLFDPTRRASPPESVEVAKPRGGAVPVGRGEGPKLLGPRPPKPDSPAEQASRLQRSEPRFKAVVVQVQGGTVMVRRGEVPGKDVMDLVEKLRRIPGVKDVILTGD